MSCAMRLLLVSSCFCFFSSPVLLLLLVVLLVVALFIGVGVDVGCRVGVGVGVCSSVDVLSRNKIPLSAARCCMSACLL